MDFLIVKAFDNPIEAHLLKTKLESEGIPCFLKDEHIISLNPLYNYAVGGIKLMIRSADLEAAQAIIQEIDQAPSLDENDQQITCPQCGSTDLYNHYKSIKGTKGLLSAIFSFLMTTFPIYYKSVYKCKNCASEFKIDR